MQEALAVDPATVTLESFQDRIQNIANLLLKEFVLVTNFKEKFKITEVEFYFNDLLDSSSKTNHPDTFTHNDTRQLNSSGCWYFHRSGPTLKGGTYKGLDLTFGEPGKCYGGVLLRSLGRIVEGKENEPVEGPCNLVNSILSANNRPEDLKSFVEIDMKGVGATHVDAFDCKSKLFLQPFSHDAKVFTSPRFGLTLKRKDEGKAQYKPYFLMKPYRFISAPQHIKKGKNHLILALAAGGMSVDDIVNLCKGQKNSILQTVTDLHDALTSLRKKATPDAKTDATGSEGTRQFLKANNINAWSGKGLSSVSDVTKCYAAWQSDFGSPKLAPLK